MGRLGAVRARAVAVRLRVHHEPREPAVLAPGTRRAPGRLGPGARAAAGARHGRGRRHQSQLQPDGARPRTARGRPRADARGHLARPAHAARAAAPRNRDEPVRPGDQGCDGRRHRADGPHHRRVHRLRTPDAAPARAGRPVDDRAGSGRARRERGRRRDPHAPRARRGDRGRRDRHAPRDRQPRRERAQVRPEHDGRHRAHHAGDARVACARRAVGERRRPGHPGRSAAARDAPVLSRRCRAQQRGRHGPRDGDRAAPRQPLSRRAALAQPQAGTRARSHARIPGRQIPRDGMTHARQATQAYAIDALGNFYEGH
ncbi:putative Cysteine desulfurase [Burkholderia multivorans]